MRLNDAKKEIIAILSNNSDVENAPREFSIIAEFSLGISKLDQIIKPDIEISSSDYQKLLECANQRLNHTPLSYITQKREFFGLDFYVSENTLIPRPDTETLVEEALNELKNIPCPDVLDLCTGTGAIGIAIKSNISCNLTLSDISEETLKITKKNAHSLINDDCTIICSDLFAKISKKFDIIVTNPPYLTQEWYSIVTDEVKKEPKSALVSDNNDGLDIIRKIIIQSPKHLKNGGFLMIECDYRQTALCAKLLSKAGFKEIKIVKDLANKERVVRGTYYA